jgi:N-methylhydantoinase A
MSGSGAVRLGIDVGGTFTHAVAVDAQSLTILGHIKVPTTHASQTGVAEGVIDSLTKLLKQLTIGHDKVSFVAHSTTQATNALLEGDVAMVGILGMGKGVTAWLSLQQTKLGEISLGHGHYLKTVHQFLDTSTGLSKEEIIKALISLQQAGAEAIVISEAFSVDDPKNEELALSVAKELGLCATAGSAVSKLYGLRARTRTATLNAAMIPKMLETATLTEKAVQQAGIKAPLMIMRSDGGVMDIKSMRERPILTMLSGPAAGVAAATMFLRISDGIFLEVGGTSTDISVIKNGRANMRYAEIGGHRLHMRTIDIKTAGVAGGSIARSDGKKITHVGPRSAHIAGLGYAAFTDEIKEANIELISPKTNDTSDYVVLNAAADSTAKKKIAITTTCAANYLNLVPKGDPAFGNKQSVTQAFAALSKFLKRQPVNCARDYLELASNVCMPIIKEFIKSRKLSQQALILYGGGGGATAIVPYLATKLKMRFELAQRADVISAIGVALALVQETVERQIVKPSQEDILKLRQQAYMAVQQMGADPASIQVFVEIDAQTSVVRATATGAASVVDQNMLVKAASTDEIRKTVAMSMGVAEEEVKTDLTTNGFAVYTAARKKRSHFWQRKRRALRVVDANGIIRFQAQDAETILAQKSVIAASLEEVVNRYSSWGDAGRTAPNIILFVGAKIIDLSGLMDASQIISIAHAELELFPNDTQIIILTVNSL